MSRDKEIIKDRIKIESLIEGLVPSGPNFKAICPFHDDHRPSLHVDTTRGTYKCWSCQAGGDVFTWIQEIEGVGFAEAVSILAERAGVKVDTQFSGRNKTELYRCCKLVEDRYREALKKSRSAIEYAYARGITDTLIEQFAVGLSTPNATRGIDNDLLVECGVVRDHHGESVDRLLGRLIFPIRDWVGRPIAFGGRISPTKERDLKEAGLHFSKYVNSPETRLFKKGSTLYGADLARKHCKGEVYVVEGYMDVLGQHLRGVKNVVGVMSASLSQQQLVLIRRLAPKVTLVFDGDGAGLDAAERSLPLFLASSLEVEIILLKEGDPGDQDILGLPRTDPLDFAIDRIIARHEDGPEGSRRAADEFAKLLSNVPRQGSLPIKVAKSIDRFAQKVGIDPKLVVPLVKPRASVVKPTQQYDPIDLEFLACLMNDEDLVESAKDWQARDPILKPLIDTIIKISDSEVPTLDAIMNTLEDGREIAIRLVGEGEWGIRGPAVVKTYRLRRARETVERLRADLASHSEDEKTEIRVKLLEAIKLLSGLDRK